jgi:CarD family transcriptional regulator
MILGIGNKVVHPSQGPCLIGAVVKKVVGGRQTSFYHLALLDESGDGLFVPLDKIRTVGIRQLVAKSEIPKLLGHLEKGGVTEKNWKQRAVDNAKLLSSGSAFDLAEVVESLTELSVKRTLSPRDRQTLDKARKRLICEIAEVTGDTKGVAGEQVDSALKKHNEAPRAKMQ